MGSWKRATWLAFPLVLVGAALYLEPRSGVSKGTAGTQPLDPKITRTVRSFATTDAGTGIDRPGLRIDFFLEPEDFVDFRTAWSHYAEVEIAFEGGGRRRALASIRGESSRRSEKKSLKVSLFEEQSFGELAFDKFLLLNMLHDPGGFEMFTANRLLGEIGLFPAYQQYAMVYMNGESRGLYLLVERPEDAIRRSAPDTVSVLRPHRNGATLKYSAQLSAPLLLNDRLRQLARGGGGSESIEELERVINLDKYLAWLAFNSLVENGDARDELFLYETRAPGQELGRLEISAWDYDDLQEAPLGTDAMDDPLLYACEMELDFLIRRSPELYGRYRRVLYELLTATFTEEVLRSAIDEVGEILATVGPANASGRASPSTVDSMAPLKAFEQRLLRRRRDLLARLD